MGQLNLSDKEIKIVYTILEAVTTEYTKLYDSVEEQGLVQTQPFYLKSKKMEHLDNIKYKLSQNDITQEEREEKTKFEDYSLSDLKAAKALLEEKIELEEFVEKYCKKRHKINVEINKRLKDI